jgi:uncharacterized lipoprotein YbaY
MPTKPTGQDAADRPLVTGQVIIADQTPALADASAHISLEDVSYADAPATTVAETVIPHIRHRPSQLGSGDNRGGTVLSFALRAGPGAPAIDPGNDYAVRVWVDRDGNGRPGPGDLYSDQRYPVLTRGFGNTVTITLGPA